jgi:hypothetical protein
MAIDSTRPSRQFGTSINLSWPQVPFEFFKLRHALEYKEKMQVFSLKFHALRISCALRVPV